MKEFHLAVEVRGYIEAETEREARAAVADAANRMGENSRPRFRVTSSGVTAIRQTDETIDDGRMKR
jgi:hypothetical protein